MEQIKTLICTRLNLLFGLLFILIYSTGSFNSYCKNPSLIGMSKAGKASMQEEIDSLKLRLRSTSSLRERLKLYGELGLFHASVLGDISLAGAYIDTARSMAFHSNKKGVIGLTDFYSGVIARYNGKYPEARSFLKRYINYSKLYNDSLISTAALYHLAVVEMYSGNYELSLDINLKNLATYGKRNDSYGAALTFMNLGNLYLKMKELQKAIRSYNQALTYLNKAKSGSSRIKTNQIRVWLNLGNTYLEMQKYELAYHHYLKSLKLSEEAGSKRTGGTALFGIADVFNAQKKYKSALNFYEKSLDMRIITGQKDKITFNLIKLGEVCLHLKKYDAARNYLLKALLQSKKCKTKPTLRDSYEKLAQLYQKKLDFPKALEFYRLYTLTKDSILNEETGRKFSELHTQYEVKAKDKQIQILAREKEVQAKAILYEATRRKAIIGLSILMLLIATLLIYLFYQKLINQKLLARKDAKLREAHFREQLLDLKMKALRAQINPHFFFNCMNSINRMILSRDFEKASCYLGKFSKLVRSILENSLTSSVPLEDELALIETYIQMEELRFKDKIHYDLHVDKAISMDNTYLPPMILQPFVENAIWHGLMHKEREARKTIRIEIKEVDNLLLCCIEDNGIGREKAQKLNNKSLLKNKSMGIKITGERLKLLSNQQMDELIKITDLKDHHNQAFGTRVEINIPVNAYD